MPGAEPGCHVGKDIEFIKTFSNLTNAAVYASKDYLDAKNQNFLRQEDIEKTAKAFDSFETVERYCSVVDMEEIAENDYNLNIKYIMHQSPKPTIPF